MTRGCAVERPRRSCVSGVEVRVLVGLGRNAVAVHAAASVLGIPAPPALVDELVRRGEGNPFFTEELVAAHLAGEAIPVLLCELLEADIASLDPAGRHVLAAFATVGRDTDPVGFLAAVVGLDEPTTEAAVRGAIDARLVVLGCGHRRVSGFDIRSSGRSPTTRHCRPSGDGSTGRWRSRCRRTPASL